MDAKTVQDIRAHITYIGMMEANGFVYEEIAREKAELQRQIAGENLKVGGGCPGENEGTFRNGEDSSENTAYAASSTENKKNWKWKMGKCRVKSCRSPQPTEVGPCNVCHSCQH